MAIELSKDTRKQLVRSIERYFQENMEDRIGNIAASALLGFFLGELGPIVYNHSGCRGARATANTGDGGKPGNP
jgi:uncharacterized protein (DUF2164 family)